MTARDEILDAARSLTSRGTEPFSPSELISEVRRRGSTYPESTLRTHIVSAMCVNAPRNHAVRYPDLERVGHGQYRLADTAGDPPETGSGRTGRESDRASRRDRELQQRVLETVATAGGTSPVPPPALADEPDLERQIDDLIRRAYLNQHDTDRGASVSLTRAGERAADKGLPDGPAGRRALLEPDELELLHQLMWDAADEVGEERRKHTGGIKWILEEHFRVETADGAGPHGKARKDALRRLEHIGAIEQIGGGPAKRTGNSWVTDPGMVQYPW